MKNITPEQLEEIEYYAEDQYTLEDLFDELNISKKLMKDERVLQAFEKGLIKHYISMASSGVSDDDIIDDYLISAEQCALWREQYSDTIKKGLQKKEDEEKQATRQFSSPIQSGIVNIILQNGKDMPPISQQVLYEDINKMIQKIKSGDMETLLTMLTTNILQLQLFNGTVTQNLMGDAGKQVDNFNKLSNMQLKVMQETRKSIMAINEIANPKRTTFIKEANQNNFIQENSEKKSLPQNEKQIEEVEIIPLKEKNNEYTL
jgi:hypothetical protein